MSKNFRQALELEHDVKVFPDFAEETEAIIKWLKIAREKYPQYSTIKYDSSILLDILETTLGGKN